MRRHVRTLARAVPGRCDHLAVAHDYRADRDFAARAGRLGLSQRHLHEIGFAGDHLA
jgi:hypothetical protein